MPDCKGCAYVGDLGSPICRACGRQEEARVAQIEATRKPLPRDLPEKLFMAKVVKIFQDAGWKTYHTHDSRRSDPGFPDLVCVRPWKPYHRCLLWAELKTMTGKVSQVQHDWIAALEAAQVEVFVWRPSDLPEIERIAND
jgi:hypothetical protein